MVGKELEQGTITVSQQEVDRALQRAIHRSIYKVVFIAMALIAATTATLYVLLKPDIKVNLDVTEAQRLVHELEQEASVLRTRVAELKKEVKALRAGVTSAEAKTSRFEQRLTRAEVVLAPIERIINKHEPDDVRVAVEALKTLLETGDISLRGDLATPKNKHGELLPALELPISAFGKYEKTCPEGSFVVGLEVKYAGTCNSQCEGDAPVIKRVRIRCAKL